MSHQERNTIVELVCGLIIFSLYFYFVRQSYQAGMFDGADAGAQIGKLVLWLIFGGIVLNIIGHVLSNVIYKTIKNNTNSSFIIDERDKLIELRAINIGYHIIGAGFIISMIALALGQSIFIVFNGIIFSFAFGTIIEASTKLYLYRRGF